MGDCVNGSKKVKKHPKTTGVPLIAFCKLDPDTQHPSVNFLFSSVKSLEFTDGCGIKLVASQIQILNAYMWSNSQSSIYELS
jgi:hypothetical protein